MRQLILAVTMLALSLSLCGTASGEKIMLVDKTVVEGTIVAVAEDGIVVRLDAGGYSERYDWYQLSQETLKKIVAEHPDHEVYADPYIEIPRVEREESLKDIPIKDPPRVDVPDRETGFFAILMTPYGLTLLVVLFLANIYVAFEIAAFRNQAPALVCAVSAVLPILGPLIFISLPGREHYHDASPEEQAASDAYDAPLPPAAAAAKASGAGGLSLAARQQEGGAGAIAQNQVFKRNEHTFNRRFFEAQFSDFFRIVPSPNIKDLVLVFKTPKKFHTAKRISRISSNDLHIQLQAGGGTKEIQLGFQEIEEIHIKHKDASN